MTLLVTPPPAVHRAPSMLPLLLALILRHADDWGDDPQAWGGEVEEWGGEKEAWGGERLAWGTDTPGWGRNRAD
jgi:hypothetical protein